LGEMSKKTHWLVALADPWRPQATSDRSCAPHQPLEGGL